MAKKAVKEIKNEQLEENDFSYLDELIQEQFDEAVNMAEADTKVNIWYDTGVYSLNYAFSKNLYGGIPGGRITGIDGLSSTGKSLIAASIMKDPKLHRVIILESEGGGHSKELLEFAGVDPKKCVVMKCSTFKNYKVNKKNNKIEEVPDEKFPVVKETEDYKYYEGAIRLLKRFVYSIEYSGKKPNILIVLDSLGNMQSVREKQGTQDVGAKQKDIAEFFRTFDNDFERTNIAFFFTNKVYTNMMDIYNPIKETGGVNVKFNSSIYCRLTSIADTDDVSDADIKLEKEKRQTSLGSSFKTVRARVEKSRFGTEYRNCWFLIDFSMGPVKHSGLFALLKDFGLIVKTGSSYLIKGWNNDKSFYKKDFIKLVISNETETIKTFQSLLEKAEIEIREKRRQLFLNDIDEVKDITDPIFTGVANDDDDIDVEAEFEMNNFAADEPLA